MIDNTITQLNMMHWTEKKLARCRLDCHVNSLPKDVNTPKEFYRRQVHNMVEIEARASPAALRSEDVVRRKIKDHN